MNTPKVGPTPRRRPEAAIALVLALALGAGCGEIAVSDGITEVGALNTAGLAVEPTVEATPRADIALDFTADDAAAESEAATLRDGREAPPDPTTPSTKRSGRSDDDDEDETSTRRSEIEDVEEESEVLIARGTYHADVKEGAGLKVRSEPEGKEIDLITADIAVKATGEGTTIDKVTWAQVRPLGDAEWDIGWVVFELLVSGEPDVDPTPTLEPVAPTEPTSAPAPTTAPDPTAIPEPDRSEDHDDSDENSDDDESDDDDSDDDESDDENSDDDDSDDESSDDDESDGDSDNEDGESVPLNALGDMYTIRGDTDLRDDADPSSSSVIAVVRKGADAVVANNTAYRYDGVVYVQVNVVGVLGWVDANQLQEY